MCVALPIAAQMALTIGSGVASLASQAQAAKAQARAQRQASLNEMKRQQHAMSSERLAQSQQETSSALEASKANREAEEAMATTRVAGAEGGVEGNAVGLAIADFAQKNAAYQTALMLQERMNNASRIMAFEGGGLQYQQNMMRINKPIQGPDVLGTLLGTAQTAMGQYQAGEMQALQRANLTRENQLFGSRLAVARQGTANAAATLQLIHAQRRGAEAQAGLFDAQRLAIPTNTR